MIDKQEKCRSNCCLCNLMMEQCSRLCIRRALYAVMIGVSPIVICLVFIGLARLILYRLEIAYYRRQKPTDRRLSLAPTQSGRLALSYTPVSHAELQRIIQGEYQSRHTHDSSISSTSTNPTARKTPRFIKSILPRREPPLASAGTLANLVIRRDAVDKCPMTVAVVAMDEPLQPTFTIVNEHDRRRPSVITIKRESIETTTLAALNNSDNNCYSSNLDEISESEPNFRDPLRATTKTLTTTTTVVVEEFLEFHSASSLPCTLSILSTVAEHDDDDDDDNINSEIHNNNDRS